MMEPTITKLSVVPRTKPTLFNVDSFQLLFNLFLRDLLKIARLKSNECVMAGWIMLTRISKTPATKDVKISVIFFYLLQNVLGNL